MCTTLLLSFIKTVLFNHKNQKHSQFVDDSKIFLYDGITSNLKFYDFELKVLREIKVNDSHDLNMTVTSILYTKDQHLIMIKGDNKIHIF